MNVWFNHSGSVIYVGGSTGLEFRRHDIFTCENGFWSVGITGWRNHGKAVIDDFGNLVEVK